MFNCNKSPLKWYTLFIFFFEADTVINKRRCGTFMKSQMDILYVEFLVQTLLSGDNTKGVSKISYIGLTSPCKYGESDWNHHVTICKFHAKRALRRSSKRKKLKTRIARVMHRIIELSVIDTCKRNTTMIVGYFGFANMRLEIRD